MTLHPGPMPCIQSEEPTGCYQRTKTASCLTAVHGDSVHSIGTALMATLHNAEPSIFYTSEKVCIHNELQGSACHDTHTSNVLASKTQYDTRVLAGVAKTANCSSEKHANLTICWMRLAATVLCVTQHFFDWEPSWTTLLFTLMLTCDLPSARCQTPAECLVGVFC